MTTTDVSMEAQEADRQCEQPEWSPLTPEEKEEAGQIGLEVPELSEMSQQCRQIAIAKFLETRVEAFTALHPLHEVYSRLLVEDRVRPALKASLLLSWVRMDLPTALWFYHRLRIAPVTQWVDLFAKHEGKPTSTYLKPGALFAEHDTVDCLLKGFLARLDEEGIQEDVLWQEVVDAVTLSPHFGASSSTHVRPTFPEELSRLAIPPLCPISETLFDAGLLWDGLDHDDNSKDQREHATDFVRDIAPFAKAWEPAVPPPPPAPLPPPPLLPSFLPPPA